MESIVHSFGMSHDALATFLKAHNGFIAGSAALAAYMKDADVHVTAEWAPNDIDIWIAVPDLMKEDVCKMREDSNYYERSTGTLNVESIRTSVKAFFAEQGFEDVMIVPGAKNIRKGMITWAVKDQNEYIEDKARATIIHRILYFKKNDRTVQVILTADVSVGDVLDTFDMSVCKVAWDPEHAYGISAREALKDVGDMRVDYLCAMDDTPATIRQSKRMDKYIARGFKMHMNGAVWPTPSSCTCSV